MAHYKRKRPRTKDLGMSDYKHMARRLGGEDNVHRLYSSCSSGHNMMFHIRRHAANSAVLSARSFAVLTLMGLPGHWVKSHTLTIGDDHCEVSSSCFRLRG